MKPAARKNKSSLSALFVMLCAALAHPASAGGGGHEDNPLLGMFMLDQLELQDAETDSPLVLEAQYWLGKDLHKLWLKTDVERVNGKTEEAELQLLYSRAIAPYWDFQLGVRKDFQPEPDRNWAVIGFQGLAPYFFEIDAAMFIGESGRSALRLNAEYELMFSQRLILSPEIEFNLYGHNDIEQGTGSGLADSQLGLRLRYEILREFAPYIGIQWTKLYGNTAAFARAAGEDTSESRIVLGLRAWY